MQVVVEDLVAEPQEVGLVVLVVVSLELRQAEVVLWLIQAVVAVELQMVHQVRVVQAAPVS
jgi:hypothetical protein